MESEDTVKTVNVPLTEQDLNYLLGITESKKRELDKIVLKAKAPSSTGLEAIDAENARGALEKLAPVLVQLIRAQALV